MNRCCFEFRPDQLSKSSFCADVSKMASFPSAKNCDRVISKLLHTISRGGIVGIWFFRYQVEIVDWGIPVFLASSYLDQPCTEQSLVISCRIFFTSCTYQRLFVAIIWKDAGDGNPLLLLEFGIAAGGHMSLTVVGITNSPKMGGIRAVFLLGGHMGPPLRTD